MRVGHHGRYARAVPLPCVLPEPIPDLGAARVQSGGIPGKDLRETGEEEGGGGVTRKASFTRGWGAVSGGSAARRRKAGRTVRAVSGTNAPPRTSFTARRSVRKAPVTSRDATRAMGRFQKRAQGD